MGMCLETPAWEDFGTEFTGEIAVIESWSWLFSSLGSAKQLLLWGPVDFIVSNPPYVFHEDMASLDAEILR